MERVLALQALPAALRAVGDAESDTKTDGSTLSAACSALSISPPACDPVTDTQEIW